MTFKLSRTLQQKVVNVMNRRGIPHEVLEEDGILKCNVNISGEKFHKIVLRAKMEKMQEEDNSSIPYIASVELNDPEVLDEVGTAFHVK